MYPVMVEKLATGQRKVQNHYRGELAEGGERVVRLIDDFIHRHSASRTGTLVTGNALGVLGLCADPSSVVVIRKMLAHPAESVRSAAIRAMAQRSRPEDYEPLLSLMPTVGGELRRVLVQALGHADAPRLAADLSDWLREGGEPGVMLIGARVVAEAGAGDSLGEGVLLLEAAKDANMRPFLVAAMAAAGDADAAMELGANLRGEDLLTRTRSVEAAALVGLEEHLLERITADPSETLRVLAAEAVAEGEGGDRARDALMAGTRDEAAAVRQACMRGLLASGDDEACDLFIATLGAGAGELPSALRAVRGLWGVNPGLAERAAEVLMAELESLRGRPLSAQEPWLQALGQVPSPLGAEWLLRYARGADGEARQMPAHRWLVMQVSNSGQMGRAALSSAWSHEADAERRMDYLWGASLSTEEDAREFLLEVVMSPDAVDYERIYAADRLARMGPTPMVAPVLKRACLGVTDAEVRPAFEELLWTWYG